MRVSFKAALLAGFIGLAGMASANATVITGVAAFATSSYPTRQINYIVDGSGTDFTTGFTSNLADGSMWLSTGTGVGGPADPAPNVVFDLGAVYSVASLRLWNYNEAGLPTRGIASATITYSVDYVAFNSLGTATFNQAPGTANVDFSQIIPIATTARYIRFENLAGFAGQDNGLFGLSEVQFSDTSVPADVPEPASLALLGLGVAGLFASRKRRMSTASV